MKTSMLLLVFLSGLILMGCLASARQETALEFQAMSTAAVEGSTKLLFITSNKSSSPDKEKEVRARLDLAINGGSYNILVVKTFYSDSHLLSGEIIYDEHSSGNGNDIRVLLISSNKNDLISYKPLLSKKRKEVQSKLDGIVSSGKYNIIKIQTVYMKGYIVAAEVYYRKSSESTLKVGD